MLKVRHSRCKQLIKFLEVYFTPNTPDLIALILIISMLAPFLIKKYIIFCALCIFLFSLYLLLSFLSNMSPKYYFNESKVNFS